MPPVAGLVGAGEQARDGVILSQVGHGGPAPRPACIAHTGCSGKKSPAPPKAYRPDERRRSSVATRKATGLLDRSAGLPDTFWYTTKRRLLGPPLVNQDLGEQRLSNPLALGVLSPDGISSSAYGTEEILIALVPAVGLAAFSLLLPMTLVVLLVMVLVLLSYREIVMVYIRPGGSYVVARENFGPRIAQVRSEERRVGKECRSARVPHQRTQICSSCHTLCDR